MFGSVSGVEVVLILVIALILFGPRKLPKIGRTLGHAMSEFRRATTDFRMSLEREVELGEIKKTGQEVRDVAADLGGVVRGSTGPPPAVADKAGAAADAEESHES